MIPLDYLVLRLVRRHLPGSIFRFALRHQLRIQPGLETRAPQEAAARYVALLAEAGVGIGGKEILILGYGGSIALGVALLEQGAQRLVLLDPYALPDHSGNADFARTHPAYFQAAGAEMAPDPARLEQVHKDLGTFLEEGSERVDLVLSSSVLEHVREPDQLVVELSQVTRPSGHQLHLIDLRDHFLKYPYEMYCHDEAIWLRFFNPPSHLNRLRPWEYESIFQKAFDRVWWKSLANDPLALRRSRNRIRPEFLSGDEAIDSVTRLALYVASPRR